MVFPNQDMAEQHSNRGFASLCCLRSVSRQKVVLSLVVSLLT